MEISDELYGTTTIEEPILQDLINSRPVQRLRHINQAGALKYTTPHATVTRYEHSIGVMLLLRKLGASLKEQIAGLLHDVPHTAFSHVIDYALEVEGHNYHEQHHRRILEESEIPAILEKHGHDINDYLDVENYPLLEQPAPDLCADRIDYTLRDTQIIRRKDMTHYIKHFAVHEGKIVMTDADKAAQFAQDYLASDKLIWGNPREGAAYDLLASALRQALDTGLISHEDLWKTDDELYAILDRSDDHTIQENLARLTRNLRVEVTEQPADVHDTPKMRYINPHVRTKDTLKRASEHSPQLLRAIREHREWHRGGHHVKILAHATPILDTN